MLCRLCVLVTALILVGGCSQGDDTEGDGATTSTAATTTTIPTTTSATATTTTATMPPMREESEPVSVARDLSYLLSDSAFAAIDVYRLTEAVGGPVVVLLHGGGANKGVLYYPGLAEAIAEQGAVVFVPNWGGKPTPTMEAGSSDNDRASCAVSYALVSL